jgi:hypothetical protein
MRPPDRQPFRRPTPRPAPRGRRQPGPATIPPAEPRSPRHRRDLLKIAYHRLGRLAKVGVAELVAADTDRLLSIAAGLEPVKGQQGKARRLVMKIARLRGGGRPVTPSPRVAAPV